MMDDKRHAFVVDAATGDCGLVEMTTAEREVHQAAQEELASIPAPVPVEGGLVPVEDLVAAAVAAMEAASRDPTKPEKRG